MQSVPFTSYPGTLDSSTNKTDRHDITEIFLKVALNTINQTKPKLHMLTSLFDRRKYLLKKDVYSLILYKYFLVGQNLCDINSIFYNNIQCIQLSYHIKWEKKKLLLWKSEKLSWRSIGIYNLNQLYIFKANNSILYETNYGKCFCLFVFFLSFL